jgi:hypothetical protein
MISQNSLTKQMYINRFTISNDFSNDLSNEIKSFCFYDTKTWELMNFIKYKKNQIHSLFKTSTISRANHSVYFGEEKSREWWIFYVHDDDGYTKQIGGKNCNCCGNYKPFSNRIYYHHYHHYHYHYYDRTVIDKIACHCIVDEYADMPPLIEIMSDDEDEDDDFDDDSIGV